MDKHTTLEISPTESTNSIDFFHKELDGKTTKKSN